MTVSPLFDWNDWKEWKKTVPSIDGQYLWALVKGRLWLFFACLGLVLVLTILYLIATPRLYESTVVVQVEQREQRAFKSTRDQAQPDDLRSDDVVRTIEQNLQNYSLFVNVVSNPKIAGNPDFLVGFKGGNPTAVSDLADFVRSHTKISLLHGTRLIYVTVDHQVPAMAQQLAQAVIDSFVAMNGDAQFAVQKDALKLLMTDSEQVQENLQKSEDSLQVYKDALLLKDRIDDQQRVIDALRQRYREKHPALIQARTLLADLMQTFDQEIQKLMTTSNIESSYWSSNSNELASASPKDRIPTELKLVEARSEVLQKEVDTESALFDNVLKQMRETDVTQDTAATDIRVVEPPPLPNKPAKPKKALILLLGLMGGSVLGIAAIAISNAVDSSIQTPVEAETLLGLPVLGVVPLLPRKAHSATKVPAPAFRAPNTSTSRNDELVMVADPGGAAAEAFRSLRAAISMLNRASDHRSILFTSALASEGKTYVSCNYAMALAQSGLKTLLVDTDLRRPAVHSRMKIENKTGFVEVISGQLQLGQVAHRDVAKDLDVVTAGGKCLNPAELLAGSGFKRFLADALKYYDRIVFDSSPVNLVSDSLLIATHVDSVCLILRATTTRRAPLHAVTLIRRAQKELSGIILNAVPPESDRLYRGYKGSYSYGTAYS
jgi:capsular exopolysaccharide synthesis family protein